MKTYLGRKVKEVHIFKDRIDKFGNLWDAEKWLTNNGYSYGSSSVNAPIAIRKGEYDLPQKWRNINNAGRAIINGVIINPTIAGEVKVILFN